MKRCITIIGARPQFIKAAALSAAIRKRSDIEEVMVHTGQHYDANMSDVFFSELGLPAPAFHLGVGSAPHGEQTGKMLEGIERILLGQKADWVLVYGDTNSTLAGALAAAKLHIPVAHVEAGLRSFNRRMPEEINRVVTDHLSTLLFVPTETARQNLAREGIDGTQVETVGDVMFDVALHFQAGADKHSRILTTYGLERKKFILATLHRAENTDDIECLQYICSELAKVSKEVQVIMPLHPRTRDRIVRRGIDLQSVIVIDPVGYLDMVRLEKDAGAIVTDSGGVQKEAFFHRVPCVTLRDETEWVELIELGWNRLVPPRLRLDLAEAVWSAFGSAGREAAPYGDGHAAERIANSLALRE